MSERMSIQEVALRLKHEYGLPQSKIAKLLGVTPLSVSMYQRGKVKYPNPTIAFRIYDKVQFDGEKVVLDIFNNEEELISAYALHKEAEAIDEDG